MNGLNNMANNTNYGSSVVNGQLVSNYTMRAMYPQQAAAPYFYGNGSKPATLAGFAPNSTLSLSSGVTGIGGGPVAEEAGENPWNPFKSPTPWAIAFLVVGLIGLRQIHWRAE